MRAIEIRDVEIGVIFINIDQVVSIMPRHEEQEKDVNKRGSIILTTSSQYVVDKNPCEVMTLIENRTEGVQYTMDLDELQRKMFE